MLAVEAKICKYGLFIYIFMVSFRICILLLQFWTPSSKKAFMPKIVLRFRSVLEKFSANQHCIVRNRNDFAIKNFNHHIYISHTTIQFFSVYYLVYSLSSVFEEDINNKLDFIANLNSPNKIRIISHWDGWKQQNI